MPSITRNMRLRNQDAIINDLLNAGVIIRLETRGQYRTASNYTMIRRPQILHRFAMELEPNRYALNRIAMNDVLRARDDRVTATPRPEVAPTRPLRTIFRSQYHSEPRNIASALSRIEVSEDGIKRSYGLEYEIYRLSAEQEDKLAHLLDTLPPHVTERDGSLSSSGIEIIFEPTTADSLIDTVKKLAHFVRQNNVSMGYNESMAGMHITYGVSNSTATVNDLQIRINRLALAVKSFGTQIAIKNLFGRDFGNYRQLPNSTTLRSHSNAFSMAGRNQTCWECRLPAWNCDIEKMVKFFSATESVFYRPIEWETLKNVFDLLGAQTNGE